MGSTPDTRSDNPDIQTLYVMFRGEDRISSGGIPVDVLGWWEIHGFSFQAALEVAYALTNADQIHVGTERDVNRRLLTSGCTFVIAGGVPKAKSDGVPLSA